jgi:hypothetical protein
MRIWIQQLPKPRDSAVSWARIDGAVLHPGVGLLLVAADHDSQRGFFEELGAFGLALGELQEQIRVVDEDEFPGFDAARGG